MRNTIHTKILILFGLLLLIVITWHFRLGAGWSRTEGSSSGVDYQSSCRSTIDLRSLVSQLSSERTEANGAASKLIAVANESRGCRDEIINELVKAMKKGLLESNHSTYPIWEKGSAILGELKAVEALDLLIDNLDLNDGLFSASMAHQPVVLAVESMGELAVPKLRIAVKNHTKREIRLAAALCLLDIGGSEALDALNSALSSETDQCVRRFITLSLPNPADAAKGRRQVSADDGEVLRQRLLAFRCGN